AQETLAHPLCAGDDAQDRLPISGDHCARPPTNMLNYTVVEHHIISGFYLRGFRDPAIDSRMGPRLWTADLKHRNVKLRAPRKVAKLTDYYAIEGQSGSSYIVETEVLKKVEDAAAPVIRRLRDGGPRPTESQRLDLAKFIALMSTRTPGWRSPVE